MGSKRNVLIILVLILSSACSLFQKDSFEGKWQLKLTGGLQENFDFEISPEYKFSFTKGVNYQGNNYEVTIQGNVSNDGVLAADIIAMGQKMGTVNGTLNFENGSGKWDATYVFGDWTAVKK